MALDLDFEKNYINPLFEEQLKNKLLHINKNLPQIAIREAIAKLKKY